MHDYTPTEGIIIQNTTYGSDKLPGEIPGEN